MAGRAGQRLVGACLALGLLFAAAPADSEPRRLSFSVKTWGVAEGLPGNHVNAITEDGDGFLWIATLAGLVRFDGQRFDLFDQATGDLPSNRLTVLHAGPDGRLWIGTEQGHLIDYRDGTFTLLAPPPYPGSRIASLAADRSGQVWISRYGAPARAEQPLVWQWSDGQMLPRPELNDLWIARDSRGALAVKGHDGSLSPWPPATPVVGFTRDAVGEVWGQFPHGPIVRMGDHKTEPVGESYAQASEVDDATLFTRVGPSTIDVYADPQRPSISQFPPGYWLYLVDRRGRSWVSDRDNRLHAFAAGSSQPLVTLAIDSTIRDIYQDRAGNLWVGTLTRGLLRVSESALQVLTPEHGVPLPNAVGIDADGQVFIEPAPAGICNPLQLLAHDRARPLPGCGWQLRDRLGQHWALQEHRLIRSDADGQAQRLDIQAEWMVEDPHIDGRVWVVGARDLYRLDSQAAEPQVTGHWALVANRALVSDGAGGVWIGGESGLWRLHDNDVLEHFDRTDGLPADNVRAVLGDGKGGLWLGTYGGGLAHFDGQRVVTLGVDRGLPEAVVSTLQDDGLGALWFAGNRGIHRLRWDELRRALVDPKQRLAALSYGREDGLANPETSGKPAAKDAEGRLWFATFGGLVAIDPAVVAAQESQPPTVQLLSVSSAAGTRMAGPALSLAADADRDIRFRFTALHFIAPEALRFRYRLEPLDADWQVDDGSRSARYPDLAPGEYRFRVQARHSSAVWTEAARPQPLNIAPRFSETRGFLLLLVVVAVATIVVGWAFANRRVRRHARELERAVSERTQALATERDVVARQAQRLGELAEARAQFMAGISHELRTPLTLILGPLRDMYDEHLGGLSAPVKQELAVTLRHAERLRRLVDRLLGIARSETRLTRLQCREADFVRFVADIVAELQPLAERRGSTIDTDLPQQTVPLWFDALQLESVLINLVANALKHTPAGTRVKVALRMDPSQPQRVSLRVSDDGPGIPAADLPRLFERFFRGSASGQSSEGGFGLGLALVREVVERHAGTIEVASDEQGTAFRVDLPCGDAHLRAEDRADFDQRGQPQRQAELVRAEALSASTAPSLPAAPLGMDDAQDHDRTTILVVDDNADLRRLVRRQLEGAYRVLEAADGDQALALLADQLPDLILSDVMMPGLDGLQLCRAIRANPEIDFVPVVLLTARASADSQVEGLQDGADGYLTKPFDAEVLRATVANLIASRRRLRDRLAVQSASTASDSMASATDLLSVDAQYLERLRRTVAAHLHDDQFGVDQLASAMNQARVSLYRHCKRLLEQSPSDLIRDHRLQRGAELLAGRAGSVCEVAYAVGFKSTSHFSSCFLARYGRRPSTPPADAAGP